MWPNCGGRTPKFAYQPCTGRIPDPVCSPFVPGLFRPPFEIRFELAARPRPRSKGHTATNIPSSVSPPQIGAWMKYFPEIGQKTFISIKNVLDMAAVLWYNGTRKLEKVYENLTNCSSSDRQG